MLSLKVNYKKTDNSIKGQLTYLKGVFINGDAYYLCKLFALCSTCVLKNHDEANYVVIVTLESAKNVCR